MVTRESLSAAASGRRPPRRLSAQNGSLPLILLVVVSLASLAARAAWIGAPCHSPCAGPSAHVLIFDERYYVNAARVIAGIHPLPASPYAHAPLGVDPNAEHTPLAKLIVAGSIELLGNHPLAWRLGSLVMGTLAILGMFALIRAAGGSRWLALAGAALMAADNLMIVHGRIATLDIYALAAMVWAAAVYLRGRPLLAGVLIGVGSCCKLVAGYTVIVLVLYELVLWLRQRERAAAALRRLSGCVVAAFGAFIGLLALLGRVAPPYDPVTHRLVPGGVFGEIHHIISFAAAQISPGGPRGIASYPWGWLVDYKPIVYLNVNPGEPAPGLYGVHPAVHFLGLISPPILLLALPALALAAARIGRAGYGEGYRLAALSVAWTAGTFLPFVLFSLALARTSYLYYMVVVMPGIYAAVAWLLPRIWRRRKLVGLWAVTVVVAAVLAYPLTPLP